MLTERVLDQKGQSLTPPGPPIVLLGGFHQDASTAVLQICRRCMRASSADLKLQVPLQDMLHPLTERPSWVPFLLSTQPLWGLFVLHWENKGTFETRQQPTVHFVGRPARKERLEGHCLVHGILWEAHTHAPLMLRREGVNRRGGPHCPI